MPGKPGGLKPGGGPTGIPGGGTGIPGIPGGGGRAYGIGRAIMGGAAPAIGGTARPIPRPIGAPLPGPGCITACLRSSAGGGASIAMLTMFSPLRMSKPSVLFCSWTASALPDAPMSSSSSSSSTAALPLAAAVARAFAFLDLIFRYSCESASTKFMWASNASSCPTICRESLRVMRSL